MWKKAPNTCSVSTTLNEELGGGIIIHEVDRDTLITEDLMEMVSKGEIPLTVVDSDIGQAQQDVLQRS